MLRVMVHDDGKISRLELAGRLDGLWVAETEKAWYASLRPDRKIEVDLRQLTAIDSAGRELLLAMHLAGVRLVVEGVWMKGLIEEITGNQPVEGAREQSQKKEGSRKSTFREQEKQQMKINRSFVQRDFSCKKNANFNERLTDAEIIRAIRYLDPDVYADRAGEGAGTILGICITLIIVLAGALAYIWLYTQTL